MPTRQIYWNIEGHYFLYAFFLITLVFVIYGVRKRLQLWKTGQAENRFDHTWTRIKSVFVYGIGHKRIISEPYPGLLHLFIFSGFAAFFFATTIVAMQTHLHLNIFNGNLYLFVKLTANLFGLLAIVGVLMAGLRRYILRPAHLENKPEDVFILGLIFLLLLSGFSLQGLRIAITPDPWAVWTIVGPWMAGLFAQMADGEALIRLHRSLWWVHLLLAMTFIGYLPYSKLFHIFLGPLNIYFRKLGPVGVPEIIDFEDESLEKYGKSELNEFSWKTLFNTDACVRCGRCENNCPAYLSGKHLNPKLIIQDIRSYMEKTNDAKLNSGTFIGDIISEDDLWACTTCRACETQCPVFVEHVDKTIEMRRHLVLMESRFPAEAQLAFKNMENNGNPWGIGWSSRGDFLQDLGVQTLEQNPNAEILYWVGCSGSFDARNQKVSKAVVTLLQAAGVDFAILGNKEKCCGDSARKLGNEYLFSSLASENIEIMQEYNVKRVITQCPHCFNMLKHEYPQLGGQFEVLHHTEFLVELVKSGKLKTGKSDLQNVVYHDSCYLGRYNQIYDQPRKLLSSVGLTVNEMPRSGEKSFCCGAGGGRMWLEEKEGERLNLIRTNEALTLSPDIVATACPFCLTMFSDGLSSSEATEDVKLLDLAEILVQSTSS